MTVARIESGRDYLIKEGFGYALHAIAIKP
jgi:hypothetical protein